MKIKAIKTAKIRTGKITLTDFLNQYIKHIRPNSVVVITSKIISITENRVAAKNIDFENLVRSEADHMAKKSNRYGRFVTFKHHALISGAGIDQSNGNGQYILLPTNPQKTAQEIYTFLSKRFKLNNFGVIITDSRSTPLRCGASGVAIGFWGFAPLKSYIGRPDIFGRLLQFERANVVDALASVAVLVMGEGDEQTPIAVIQDIDFISFNKLYPTKKDLQEFYLSLDEDIFHQFYKDIR